ncbi:hypothetical protein TNCV_2807461 [Trichonephila clavipes]|nr:hypothetical protein TNCV_2807461 [Trichonephila clavipes]
MQKSVDRIRDARIRNRINKSDHPCPEAVAGLGRNNHSIDRIRTYSYPKQTNVHDFVTVLYRVFPINSLGESLEPTLNEFTANPLQKKL